MMRMTAAPHFWTIGYALHTRDSLLSRLRAVGVTALADIRTHRGSRYWTDFDVNGFAPWLERRGVRHVFLGDQLGGKPAVPALYPGGRMDYGLLRARDAFQTGIDRLMSGADKFSICLMCAEKDPLDCHRAMAATPELRARGAAVTHLLADGGRETAEETEARLLSWAGETGQDLFAAQDSPGTRLARAYEKRRLTMAPRWVGGKAVSA